MGRNSSSVFVFFRTLFQLLRDRAPEPIVVAMDSRVPTFRHVRYEQYKATREKAPDDLHAQVPVIEEILEALRVPCISADGYEADDVIATLAEGCRSTGAAVLDPLRRQGHPAAHRRQRAPPGAGAREPPTSSSIPGEKVFESKGVYPEQIVDFLALTGDSSDNVPGVPGIGEKTAQKLLAQFGTLDAMYAKLAEVTPASVRTKLETRPGVGDAFPRAGDAQARRPGHARPSKTSRVPVSMPTRGRRRCSSAKG